jgi:SAM-dependent methyltransferase
MARPPAAAPDNDDRLRREAEFHDKAFGEGTRSSVSKFYEVTRTSRALYERLIGERAAGARVLEYGCGPGSYANYLAQRGAHVTGIDISPVAIEQAQEAARRAGVAERTEFRVMNAEALQAADATFDLVCGTAILHHLDLPRAYAEVARTLKPNGSAVFEEPLGHNPLINLFRRRTPHLRTPDEHPLLVSDLELAGKFFADVDVRYFHLLSLGAVPFRRTPLFAPVLRTLDALDRLLFAVLPPVRKHAWQSIIVLRRPAL